MKNRTKNKSTRQISFYTQHILAYQLACKLPISNTMEIPTFDKIVVSIGLPRILQEKKQILSALFIIEKLTGQKAYPTYSKKQVSSLKIQKNMIVGAASTLRRKKMISFFSQVVFHLFQQEQAREDFFFQHGF